MNSKPLIIAIVGDAGCGKDTAATWLVDHTDWNLIISYTTRPMREGEQQRREHYFVTQFPEFDTFGAHAVYGGYHYWTTMTQLTACPTSVYVIDEDGLAQLRQAEAEGHISIFSVLMTRRTDLRLASGVSQERMDRDATRQHLPPTSYDTVIHNDKSLKALYHRLSELVSTIHNRP